MDIRKALVLGGVMAAAFAVPTTAASASVALFPSPPGSQSGSPANVFTATTSLTNRGDSGGNGDWAIDTITRTLTIKETSHTGSVYSYTATVSDTGTFKTSSNAFTPNQGAPYTGNKIKGTVQGTMTGTANYSFTATSLPTQGRNLGVPGRESGTPASGSPQTTSLWYEQAFPAGTTGGTGIGTYSWTYLTGSGACTQDNGKSNGNGRGNGFGNRGQGNNPGCSCGDDHSRGRGNSQQKGCTQGRDNRGQGLDNNAGGRNNNAGGNNNGRNNNGRGRNNGGGGGNGGSRGGGPSKSSAEKWVDSSSNGDGQKQADGNITGS